MTRGERAAAATLRLRVVVRGRVQGVWFRESTRIEAERLGVDGWVKNRPDGRVEAVLEGDPSAVRALEAWCASGPPSARVVEIVSVEEPPLGEVGFRVVRG